ncbi:Ig-like domain-containing protein, partial [Vibrio sp. Of7-15]|uniref:Ig-like domain-containing protein n=1 Tax=Vibrio sp. Of7-15 TaxID=2724879 RepID=UPI001EF3189D
TQEIIIDTEIGTDGDDKTSAVSIDGITEDRGESASDFITNDNTLVINGKVELATGDRLTVNFNGTDYTTDNGLVINADGTWTLDVTGTELADGSYDVTATVTDVAGNSEQAEQTIVIDTQEPETSDGQNSIEFDDNYIEDGETGSVTFTGQVEAGAQVGAITISDGQTLITVDPADITVGVNGQVTVSGQDLSLFDEGKVTVTMEVTDVAGNAGHVSNDSIISLNDAPTVKSVDLGCVQEDAAGGKVIDLSLLLNAANDQDNDPLHFTNVSVDPAHGSVDLVVDGNGVVTSAIFHPAKDYSGNDVPLQFTVSDGDKTADGTAVIDVIAVADAPEVSVILGEPVIVQVGGSDGNLPSYTSWDDVKEQYGSQAFDMSDGMNSLADVDGEYHYASVNPTHGYQATGAKADEGIAVRGQGLNDTIVTNPLSNADDILIGDDGILGNNDRVNSSDVNDTLTAGGGNDILIGEQGDDTLYGGTGTDTAVFAGNFSDYTITNPVVTNDGGQNIFFAVTDNHVPAASHNGDDGLSTRTNEGSDDLYDIERLQFADGTYRWNETAGEWQKEGDTFVEYPLDISAQVTDIDGSESIQSDVVLSGLPVGSSIFDANGQEVGTYNADNNTWTLTGTVSANGQQVDINDLIIRVPADNTNFEIDVTAVAVESNGDTASGTAQAAPAHEVFVDQGDAASATLMTLVIDSSGSMDDYSYNVDGDQKTRMEIALDATISLLQNVKSQPGSDSVLVQLVDFDNDLYGDYDNQKQSLGWFTIDEAIAQLNTGTFAVEGGTDYEEAVYGAIDGYTKLPEGVDPATTNDVVYFISDGESNGGWDSNADTAWQNFTAGKDVTAVGIVPPNTHNPTISSLENLSSNVVYIPDTELKTKLPELAPTLGQPGELLQHIAGEDGVAVVIDVAKVELLQTINADGSVGNASLTTSIDNGQLQLATEYGSLFIDSDGSYQFQPAPNAPVIEPSKAVGLEFMYTVVDANGVESEQQLSLNISPSGETNLAQGHSLSGSTGDDSMFGTDSADMLFGQSGDDDLLGMLGNDILVGGLGHDILTGGAGDDILIGGEGQDTFKFNHEPTSSAGVEVDIIEDFSLSDDNHDILDLSDLLEGETRDTIEDFLSIREENGNVVLDVSSTKDGDIEQVIKLENVSMSDLTEGSSGMTEGDILRNLIDSSKLVITD